MTRRYRRRPRWLRRLRRWLRRGNHKAAAAVALAGLALVILAGHHSAPAPDRATAATAAAAPGGSAYTPASWARALLRSLGDPRTACNLGAVTAWEAAEGGNWADAAQDNPLNTTMPEPGSRAVNPAGVQAYPSWREGFTATLDTLRNGLYGAILAALAAGNSAQAVADAVAASPWGTRPFDAEC